MEVEIQWDWDRKKKKNEKEKRKRRGEMLYIVYVWLQFQGLFLFTAVDSLSLLLPSTHPRSSTQQMDIMGHQPHHVCYNSVRRKIHRNKIDTYTLNALCVQVNILTRFIMRNTIVFSIITYSNVEDKILYILLDFYSICATKFCSLYSTTTVIQASYATHTYFSYDTLYGKYEII